MSVISKVKAVEKVFAALDQEIQALGDSSGLGCITGCGKCCYKADIEASPLEFLPYAFHLFLTKKIDAHYQNLLTRDLPLCVIFKPVLGSSEQGSCSEYAYRGLICRLFGFSAVRNKYGATDFVTCKPIKENQPKQLTALQSKIRDGHPVPMMNDYYFKLRSIDPDLGTMLLPINKAILEALEYVMAYYAYRQPPPVSGKLSA